MNFLDPTKWNDLEALEKKYENLTEELLHELHDVSSIRFTIQPQFTDTLQSLKPYFLRRTKA